MDCGLPEWTVLALLREEPRHGFAIASLMAPEGSLGGIWHLPRPMVYRALGRLDQAGLVTPTYVESQSGPQRTVFALTPAGCRAVDEWLRRPVEHVRDFRSALMMKLALLDRRGLDAHDLLVAQCAVLRPLVAALAAERAHGSGFTAVVAAWRHTNAEAALEFITGLLEASRSAG